MKWTWTFCALFFLHQSVSAAPDIAWDSDSDPVIMSSYFNAQFSTLPREGKVASTTKYWSGDAWVLRRGNINYRWYAKQKIGFDHNSPTKERAARMKIPELAELSPTEKYDLFTGRYDYPLRNEVAKIASIEALSWEGICHGWSAATMNHNEPEPKLMINPDGIKIPFGSTDIKALLSYYYAFIHKVPDTHQMGKRCYKGPQMNSERDCLEDMNAGAFHIVLANRLGIDGKGFIADFERYDQVWNHPITAYKTEVVRELRPDNTSAPGTVKKIEVKTHLTLLDAGEHDWGPVIGTKKQAYETLTFQYKLDISSERCFISNLETNDVFFIKIIV